MPAITRTGVQAALTFTASLSCAVAALWHPWAAFVGAALAAFIPIAYSRAAILVAMPLNGLGFVVGLALWLLREVA